MSKRKRARMRVYIKPNGVVDVVDQQKPHGNLITHRYRRTLASIWVRRFPGTKETKRVSAAHAKVLERIFIKHMLRKKELALKKLLPLEKEQKEHRHKTKYHIFRN